MTLQGQLQRRTAARPRRKQEVDRLAVEPTRRERQCIGGRRIQPLDVVDRHEQPAVLCESTERVQEPGGDCARLRGHRRLGTQQRHLQGMELRARHAC